MIRPATATDVPALTELASRAYAHYVARMGQRPLPMDTDYTALVAAGQVWVAERDGAVVGMLVLVVADTYLLLNNLAVDPNAQGLGLGRRLLAFAEEHARAQRLTEIRLYTNEAMTENLAYYPRHGYTETHRAVQDGYRRVFFTKQV